MRANESSIDRVIRIILGAVLILFGFFFLHSVVGTVAGIVGLVLLLTGVVGFCPLYALLRVRTAK